MTQTHVTDPIKDLTLSIGGERIQVAAGRLDYYSTREVTMVTIRPQDGSEPLVLTVAPADAGRRVFGRRGTLRLLGYAAAATDIGEIDPGVMTWTQVCSCNAARLKRDLMALEPVLSEDELTAMALA
jgi:hypothetical protein